MSEQEEYYNPYRLFVGSFIPNWLLEHKEISSTAKLCFARLAQFMGKDGKCFPTHAQLSEAIGVSERYIVTIIKELEKKKLIKVIRPTGANKLRHFHNEYKFIKNDSVPHEQMFTSNSEQMFTSSKENHIREPLEEESMEFFPESGKDSRPISFTDFRKRYSNARNKPEATKVVDYFMWAYKKKFRSDHPLARAGIWAGVLEDILYVSAAEEHLDYDEMVTLIDKYLRTTFKSGYKHSVFHFKAGIKDNRFWEELY